MELFHLCFSNALQVILALLLYKLSLDSLMIQISTFASLFFIALFISIFATGILELRWSGVSIEEWWRNEQFWVIGGVSAHLFAVVQGLLKVLAGIDTNFTVTSKAVDDEEFGELYTFKWTTLLIPPTTLLIINLVGVVAGISDAINNGYQSWGPLFGKLFFAFWVIVHLYPFLKGLMGRQNRTPTIVVIWSVLLASIFSLLWVRIDPFILKTKGPDVKQCGINCWSIASTSLFGAAPDIHVNLVCYKHGIWTNNIELHKRNKARVKVLCSIMLYIQFCMWIKRKCCLWFF